MTYCYWGARAYGKVNQQCLFRYNRKTVVQHQIGVGISGKFKAFKWEYVGDKQIRTRYYKEIDKDDITRYVKSEDVTDQWLLETQTDKGLKNNTCVEYDWLGKGMFNLPPKKLAEKVYNPKDLHPLYNDYGRAWDQHFFNDLITCDLYNPQPWILDNPYEPFVESFKKCKNVVGFKSNMVDWLIGLLGFFVPCIIFLIRSSRLLLRNVTLSFCKLALVDFATTLLFSIRSILSVALCINLIKLLLLFIFLSLTKILLFFL